MLLSPSSPIGNRDNASVDITNQALLLAKQKRLDANTADQSPVLVSYIAPLSGYANSWVSVESAADASMALLNKVYSPLSLEEWHEAQLEKALKAIQKGDDDRAIRLLEALLAKVPQAVDARENLASLYLTYGDIANAQEVTEEGLRYAPQNVTLLTIQARLYMAQDHPDQAISLLLKHHPSMQKHSDYYGTLAAAYQAAGQLDKAGSLYQALLQVDPGNGQYWLGYAIFMEYQHKLNQAIDAYARASQNPDTDSIVREYAENRLNHLQG
jgi:MSHA biogenesis protein MshN